MRDPDEAAYEVWEDLREALAGSRKLHGISKGDAVKLKDVSTLSGSMPRTKPPVDTGLETDE